MARVCFLAGLMLTGCATTADPRIPEVVQNYPHYGFVDQQPRVAPALCAPGVHRPAPRESVSRDESTHGRKIYYLFAKDRLAYLHAKDADQPEGQVVVKESWLKPGGEAGPLFIMMKTAGEWVYATTDASRSTITAAGRLASCIECHESASTRDRMFGLPSGK